MMRAMRTRRAFLATAVLLCAAACSDGEARGTGGEPDGGESVPSAVDPSKQGPYVVGTTSFELAAHDSRKLPVQIWYPAAEAARSEAATGHPFAHIEPPGERRDKLAQLVADAPAGCTTQTFHAADGAPAAERDAPWPVVLFSHCNACTRFSELSVAERLASWGFVVAAPDHEQNTLYDELAGVPSPLNPEFLQVRGKDMKDVLDAVLAGGDGVPEGLRGHLDEDHIGMFGHSFGSITTGLVLQDEARVKVGAMLAAPPELPVITGVSVANLKKPGLFVLAEEDNSVGALGNDLIHQNYENYPAPAWLLSVKDAGHWSFSDIAGIVPGLMPGCGEAKRQSDPSQAFSYIDPDVGRDIAVRYVTAFLAAQLLGQKEAAAYLSIAAPDDLVTLVNR
jgi:dienelactone hydrolase